MPGVPDLLVAAVLVIGLPVYGAVEMPRMRRRLEAGLAIERVRQYRQTVAMQWLLTGLALSLWAIAGRTLPAIGLGWPAGWRLGVTAGLAAAGVGFFAAQLRRARRSPDALASVRRQVTAQPVVEALIPRSAGEARLFVALSLTAGICEEILYRGYLLWFFEGFTGRATAAALAVAAFGVAHVYQGARGMLVTGVAGGLGMAVYLLTGSLLAPIVLHAATDIGNGLLAREALLAGAASPAPPPDAGRGEPPSGP